MKIKDILSSKRPVFSFEVFPPRKEEQYESIRQKAKEVAALGPDFMSVTYGAGGGIGHYTTDIASFIKDECGVTPIAHLTCITSTREQVLSALDEIRERGIENVLALRGDIPEDGVIGHDYRYACELISDIRQRDPSLCIGAACYPEGHPKSASQREDIMYLKNKVDSGVDFLTTQLFLDNDHFYHFLYRIREAGINTPVLAGIMPITSAVMIRRAAEMAGATPPKRFLTLLDYFGDDPAAMEQAGIAYATEQIVDLIANHVNGVHLYTMNKPHIAAKIKENISAML